MLHIENISKTFGGVVALDACSFEVPAKQITALVGPNGAGKTTLFDVITGLVKPDEGLATLKVAADNIELTGLAPHNVARAGAARTWQQVRLFKYLTILDHLQLASSIEDTKLFANLVAQPVIDRSRHEEILERFGIDRPLDTVVTDLSYGQRKLLQLAMALEQPHQILLLDEPVAGVNPKIQERIEQLLLDLKEQNETVVVIEHDMEFVKRLADNVVVLDQGRVLVEGKPTEALSDQRVVEAYLGT